jgi:hypothetical protein
MPPKPKQIVIPKTLVVGINLHGEIPLNKDGSPIVRKVEDEYIIKLNIVAPDVPNISTIENSNSLGEVIKEHIKTNPWLNDPMLSQRNKEQYKQKMIDFVNELKEEFIEKNKPNIRGVEAEYFRSKTGKRSSSEAEALMRHQQNFVYNTGSMYKIKEFTSGNYITNKLFFKFSQEELAKLEVEENGGFNKIVLYNFSDDSDVDIFQLLGPDYTEITLFNLIDFLKGMGVENIILIDLSCSVCISEEILTARARRRARLEMGHTYGGSIKKKSNKTRRRRSNNKKYKCKKRKSLRR